MTMQRAIKAYPQPKHWADVQPLVVQMRKDMLRKAQDCALDAGQAAERLGMSRNEYVQSCRRLKVPVEHLMDKERGGFRAREDTSQRCLTKPCPA